LSAEDVEPAPDVEIERLRRRLARERRIRVDAEGIAERVVRELYDRQTDTLLLETIASAANEAATVDEALEIAVHRVCEHTGWPVGHVHLANAEGTALLPTRIWHLARPEKFLTFRDVTMGMLLARGEGLPGRVLASGEPAWIVDATPDTTLPRARAARDIGLRTGFAFPVRVGREVVATLEFFSEHDAAPDARILGVMSHVGRQLGHVVERKRAEDELRRREIQLTSAQQLAHIGSWEWDLRRDCVHGSAELARIYGFTAGDLPASFPVFLARVHADDRERMEAMLRRAVESGEPFECEHRILRPDGAVRTLDSRAEVVVDEHGKPDRVTGTGQDITQRAQLEAQLQQSQKMQAIGLLAGGIAHDFNNLLTAILGYNNLLLRQLGDDSRCRGSLDQIGAAAERATALTRRLLTFSRRQVLIPEILDVGVVVQGINGLLKTLIGEFVELVAERPPALGKVRADQGQIEQVIMNLVVNARDAMPVGGKVTVRTDNVDLDEAYAREHPGARRGPHVLLAVTDTGLGMDAETQARIFEPFFTTKGRDRGTGLGLSIVYGIVKQSRGYISVASRRGLGTTFSVYLPRVESVEPVAPRAPTAVVAAARGGHETVLLVEDDRVVREFARTVLESAGYRILEAGSPEDALSLARRFVGSISLLLVDVFMPRMNGPELSQEVLAAHPDAKRLYMSGYTGAWLAEHGIAEIEGALLEKPFLPDVLLRKVREVLESPVP
jgi:two-component system, cell cycle sensor histidine kinase and response regulator CckA